MSEAGEMIRCYMPEDLGHLVNMHREMGMTYPFPQLHRMRPCEPCKGRKPRKNCPECNGSGQVQDDNPLFVRKIVMEKDSRPVMAMLARMTTEGFLLQDLSHSPETRWEWFKQVQAATFTGLWQAGFEDVHAFLPPNMDNTFGKRLISTGWVREKWPAYCKYLEAPREA